MTRKRTVFLSVVTAFAVALVLAAVSGCQDQSVSANDYGTAPIVSFADDASAGDVGANAPMADETERGDYSNPARWSSTGGDRSKSADIFLAQGTGTGDSPHATFEQAMANRMSNPFPDVTNTFYAPYRFACIQGSGCASMDGVPTNDIIAAFQYYWDNFNKNADGTRRPFILYGFSQGAYVMWNLLLQLIDKNEEMQKYHIATYAIGSPGRGAGSYGASGNAIRDRYFSKSATDLNKIICYAPYHVSDDVSGMGAAFAARGGSPTQYPYITNPVSWTVDDKYYECNDCGGRVVGAQVDYAKGVLIVTGPTTGNGSWGYHGQESTFFGNSMKKNAKDRIDAWYAAYGSTSIKESERIVR